MLRWLRVSVEYQWYNKPTWLWLFWLLVPMFWLLTVLRRHWLSSRAMPLAAPVIVVGNIAVGGTGKTPVLISLVKFLQAQGLRPGVVSRGYGGSHQRGTLSVEAGTCPTLCGDEPVMIAQLCACPVIVGRQRPKAAQRLIAEFGCNIILSDDGLQHYALARDLEILVLDASRGLGNGWCFPMGPLRESARRLTQVDFVLRNGGGVLPPGADHLRVADTVPASRRGLPLAARIFNFCLEPQGWRSLREQTVTPVTAYPWRTATVQGEYPPVVAVAGIGHPQRFFNTLAELGVVCEGQGFPDHHDFKPEDFAFARRRPVLMTSKDAVKCRTFALSNWWALEVVAALPPAFLTAFWRQLQLCSHP